MNDITLPDYLTFATELQSAGLAVNPAEVHGLLTGMLCGGLNVTDNSWQPLIFDYTNDGVEWPDKPLKRAQQALDVTTKELTGTDMELSLLVPDEDVSASLFDIADGLAEWVNHFISGLGLVATDLKKASVDVKEAIRDLEEISKLGIDEDDDLQEQATLLEHVMEHVKVCVLTIYAELGQKPAQPLADPTIH